MIKTLKVQSFKSLESVEVELGQVNVFIGANGSGKTNLLEALGVLSAAAEGKVNDQTLLQRGVRLGVPALYKSSFRRSTARGPGASPYILFTAADEHASYSVSLHNPLEKPKPSWRFKHELWQYGSEKLADRALNLRGKLNPEQGLAALKAVEYSGDHPGVVLLRTLQDYAIFTPTTPVLRGIYPEMQPRTPLGLSGGQLPDAFRWFWVNRESNQHARLVCREAISLIDWAESAETEIAFGSKMPLSSSAAASPGVIRFQDRYMDKKRNFVSGYDASEGALFVLFLAVLAAHEQSPVLCAVDNADHGLNPRLARSLMKRLCGWYLNSPSPRQILLTTHNPLVLDGLTLQDDRVRLFTVSRTTSGRTTVNRVAINEKLLEAGKEWPLSQLWVMGHLGGIGDV